MGGIWPGGALRPMNFSALLPDSDYRFQMRFERGRIEDFFGATSDHCSLMAERRHWLYTAHHIYAALRPEGVAPLAETIGIANECCGFSASLPSANVSTEGTWDNLMRLGLFWEPDFLVLVPDDAGAIRLQAACVCFPSSWSLEEKMGQPIEHIHEPVPGLNQQIGPQVHAFLAKLKPGVAWLRSNWGLSSSPQLNQHPSRKVPPLAQDPDSGQIWFRVENQALVALPCTGGVLFGIRVESYPLTELQRDSGVAKGLLRAIRTMPEAVAGYKGLAAARRGLIELLRA